MSRREDARKANGILSAMPPSEVRKYSASKNRAQLSTVLSAAIAPSR
jgi:hypothetical protein